MSGDWQWPELERGIPIPPAKERHRALPEPEPPAPAPASKPDPFSTALARLADLRRLDDCACVSVESAACGTRVRVRWSARGRSGITEGTDVASAMADALDAARAQAMPSR